MPFELPPPDEQTAADLESISRSPIKPADARYVRFYTRPKLNKVKSYGGEQPKLNALGKQAYDGEGKPIMERIEGAGRPIYDELEYIEIHTPGDKDTVIDRPIRNVDRYVWAEKYAAFKNGAVLSNGIPLEQWGGISPDRVLELAHFRIKTVEQLADVADSSLQNLGFKAREEREKARGYLAVMKGEAPVAALKEENEKLKASQAVMLERLAALEKLATQTNDAKKGKAAP